MLVYTEINLMSCQSLHIVYPVKKLQIKKIGSLKRVRCIVRSTIICFFYIQSSPYIQIQIKFEIIGISKTYLNAPYFQSLRLTSSLECSMHYSTGFLICSTKYRCINGTSCSVWNGSRCTKLLCSQKCQENKTEKSIKF